MKKIEMETCIKFEDRSINQHQDIVSESWIFFDLSNFLILTNNSAGMKALGTSESLFGIKRLEKKDPKSFYSSTLI